MEISEEDAAIICGMAYWCHSEGVGPDYDQLLTRIGAAYPNLSQHADADVRFILKDTLQRAGAPPHALTRGVTHE